MLTTIEPSLTTKSDAGSLDTPGMFPGMSDTGLNDEVSVKQIVHATILDVVKENWRYPDPETKEGRIAASKTQARKQYADDLLLVKRASWLEKLKDPKVLQAKQRIDLYQKYDLGGEEERKDRGDMENSEAQKQEWARQEKIKRQELQRKDFDVRVAKADEKRRDRLESDYREEQDKKAKEDAVWASSKRDDRGRLK